MVILYIALWILLGLVIFAVVMGVTVLLDFLFHR